MKRSCSAALAAVLCLGGCSSKGSPTAAPDSTPASPTASPTVPRPVLPDAITFVRYYWTVANEAMRTLDTARLARLQAPSCGQCTGALEWIRAVRAAGGEIVGGATHVERIEAHQARGNPGRWLVEMATSESRGWVTGAGRLDKTYPAGRASDVMLVDRHGRHWKVVLWRTH